MALHAIQFLHVPSLSSPVLSCKSNSFLVKKQRWLSMQSNSFTSPHSKPQNMYKDNASLHIKSPPPPPQRRSLPDEVIHKTSILLHGCKYLLLNMRYFTFLKGKSLGQKLTRWEERFLRRLRSDVACLRPLLLFLITPYSLPLLVLFGYLYPHWLPSTMQTNKTVLQIQQKTRWKAEKYRALLKPVIPPPETIEMDVDLNTMEYTTMKNLCYFLGLRSMGTASTLRKRLHLWKQYIDEDDILICENLATLSKEELIELCLERRIPENLFAFSKWCKLYKPFSAAVWLMDDTSLSPPSANDKQDHV